MSSLVATVPSAAAAPTNNLQAVYDARYHPQVQSLSTHDNTLRFQLSGVDVSFANGLRRTILSNIPMVIFRTTPKERNKCTILTNTTRYNNEIIKQRLGCIPIHITSVRDFPLEQYVMELTVENTSDTVMHVTTGDFRIKHKPSGEYLSEEKIREIFPRHPLTQDFISFLYLRPKISETIPGEAIRLTCDFDLGTAEEDGMYNAVCTCSYAFTEDVDRQNKQLDLLRQTWKEEGKTPDEVDFESANWRLLEGKRPYLPDSFDFVLETVGVHSNVEIASKACEVLRGKLAAVRATVERGKLVVKPAVSTIPHCFDVTLEHEDYTVGKILEHLLHVLYYERGEAGKQQLSYCGFVKMHPHDTFSTIRLGFEYNRDAAFAAECILQSCLVAESVLQQLQSKLIRMRSL